MEFLTAEWRRHYAEERQMHDQEKAMIEQLVAACTMERMGMYLHYHDDHAYLTHGHMRNDIIRSGWSEIERSSGQEMSKSLPEMYGSWDAPHQQTRLPTEVNTPLEKTPSLSEVSGSQPITMEQKIKITRKWRSRCKYCTIVGHFAKDCTVPHQMCHHFGDGKCVVPKMHKHYRPLTKLICPYVGFHSVALYKQVERSGIDEGEEVNELAE